VKNMEEHLLCPVLTCQKLNIINDQDIDLHVKIREAFNVPILDGIHKLVHKFFRRYIQDELVFQTVFYFISNGLHQMGFTKTYSTIYHQGVEGSDPWLSGYSIAC